MFRERESWRDSWRRLDKRNLGFSIAPQSIIGPTLVWSDKAFENQLSDFIDTRIATTHKILYELMARGAPIYSVVDVSHIENMKGPLLVINPHLFPEEELKKIFAHKNGPIILIGKKTKLPAKPDSQFEDTYPPNQLFCSIYGLKKKFEVKIRRDEEEKIPEHMAAVKDPLYFTQELYFRKVSDSFLKSCAQIISASTNGIEVSSAEDSVKVLAMEQEKSKLRLLIGNDSNLYANPEIDMEKNIGSIKVLTEFPGKPVMPDGSKFRVRIPGKGMVILDVSLAKKA